MRWFEEPVSSDDLAGLGLVRDQVTPDVAAGEYGYDLVYFHRMGPYVDCLQIDVTRCGGISEFLRGGRGRRRRRAGGVRRTARRTSTCAVAAGDPEPAAPGVVPRPRPDRVDALRRRGAGYRRRVPGCRWTGPATALEFRADRAQQYRVA